MISHNFLSNRRQKVYNMQGKRVLNKKNLLQISKSTYNNFSETTMSWTNWTPNFWSKEQPQLDLSKAYLKVEFLTQQEKVKKDIILGSLLQQSQDDQQTLILYEQHYKCSHRFTFRAPSKNLLNMEVQQITVKQIMASIILSKDETTKSFYNTYINGIEVIMKNNESLSNADVVELYTETEINSYDPSQILQIIYIQKPFWERVKNKTKETIKKIPSLVASLLSKILGLILSLLGLNGSIASLLWKAVPSKMILEWLGLIFAMFFPALAPLLGLSKLMF